MEYFNSFFQNIKDKLTNPFFGTLIIVFILHHPQFWYSLFNFDDGVNLQQKIIYLREIGSREFSIGEILKDILCAIFFVVIGYLIVLATRTLSMWIEFRLMPMITKKIVSENLVMRTEYDEVVKERNEYSEKYEEQRKAVRLMSKDYDFLNEEANNKNTQINQFQTEITTLNNSVSKEKSNADKWFKDFKNAEKVKAELSDQVQILGWEQDQLRSDNNEFIEFFFRFNATLQDPAETVRSAILKANYFKENNLWQTFLIFARDFSTKKTSVQYNMVLMEEHGIITRNPRKPETYKFTNLGRFMWEYKKQLSIRIRDASSLHS